MPRCSPPTTRGLPRRLRSAACSTEAKNASASKWVTMRFMGGTVLRRFGIRGHAPFSIEHVTCSKMCGVTQSTMMQVPEPGSVELFFLDGLLSAVAIDFGIRIDCGGQCPPYIEGQGKRTTGSRVSRETDEAAALVDDPV